MAQDTQHPPDLPVPATQQGDPEPGAALRFRAVRETSDDLDRIELQPLAIHPDSALRPVEHLFLGKPADRDVVGLGQPVAGMGDPVGEFPIVGQQHQPRTVAVEPPDRNERAERMGKKIHHRGPPRGIRPGREMAEGFVENHVPPRLGAAAEPRPVHPDVTERRVRPHPRNPNHLTVHGDPAFGDHLLRAAARGDPGGRNHFLEPLRRHSEPSPLPVPAPRPAAVPGSAALPPGGAGTAAASASSNSRSFGRSSSRSSSNRSRNSFVVP